MKTLNVVVFVLMTILIDIGVLTFKLKIDGDGGGEISDGGGDDGTDESGEESLMCRLTFTGEIRNRFCAFRCRKMGKSGGKCNDKSRCVCTEDDDTVTPQVNKPDDDPTSPGDDVSVSGTDESEPTSTSVPTDDVDEVDTVQLTTSMINSSIGISDLSPDELMVRSLNTTSDSAMDDVDDKDRSTIESVHDDQSDETETTQNAKEDVHQSVSESSDSDHKTTDTSTSTSEIS